ncbi:MAG: M1 family aminopeptidase [Candidatus Acidiferrales bacterium]
MTLTPRLAYAQAPPQASQPFPFHATHYSVEATLHPEDSTLSGRAKVDFIADAPSRTLLVELHEDLKLTKISDAEGKPLTFDRSSSTPLNVSVLLPDAVSPGKQVSLTFEYTGSISNAEDSPSRGVLLGSVDKNSAFLLLPARWFPLTNYPGNRYTGEFKIIVPDTFAVVGTGRAGAPATVPPAAASSGHQIAYTFTNDRPAATGTFVAGQLQLNPVQTEGLQIAVYTSPQAPSTEYANALAPIINFFSNEFGPLPDPNVTIAQMPDGSLQSFSAPGLLLISARQWTAKPNASVLAELAASQWWGGQVIPASASDVWISDGLARYCEAMYVEQSEGPGGLRRVLDEFAVGALMFEDAAPISQAQRLGAYSDEYRSIVMGKGPMVFHMLRAILGDAAFKSLLHDFYSQYAGKPTRLEDFEKLVAARVPAPQTGVPEFNPTAFFSQWLNSTGVPEFKLDYIVYRTIKGFKVVGKIQQELETFNMPVELRVETEGNPENKTVLVSGKNTPFEIDTFGRPKPSGVTIDPNNDLLKSSTKLRVRAAIARGESLAEVGKYYEAIQDYSQALDIQPNNSLAHFRTGEAMFYQKNWQAAANEFRSALDGDLDPAYKWVEVWSHIYLGKIFDLTGQRDRAANEYSKAQQLKDDTGGAQEEAAKYLQKPYTESSGSTPAAPTPATPTPPAAPSAKPAKPQ